MRRFVRSRSDAASGFTLLELLTVIVIIGVLAGMISTAIIAIKHKASDVQRDAEVATLAAAIRAYRFEYQEWPCPDEGTYAGTPPNNNGVIINDWLMKVETGKNSRNVKYLNRSDYSFDAAGNIVDPKGVPYTIVISFTDDTVSVN